MCHKAMCVVVMRMYVRKLIHEFMCGHVCVAIVRELQYPNTGLRCTSRHVV